MLCLETLLKGTDTFLPSKLHRLNLFVMEFEGRFHNNVKACRFQMFNEVLLFSSIVNFWITLHNVNNDSEREVQYCCLLLVFTLHVPFFFPNKSVAMLSLSVLNLDILSAEGGSWVKVVAGK